MPDSRSRRRAATITIQTLLGALLFAIWALNSVFVLNNELIDVIVSALPYFVAFELGILSRYVPGVKTAAKRLEA